MVYNTYMNEHPMIIFYVVFSIVGLLLLWVVISDLMKGKGMRQIGKDLVAPVSVTIGFLIIWYVYMASSDMIKDIF